MTRPAASAASPNPTTTTTTTTAAAATITTSLGDGGGDPAFGGASAVAFLGLNVSLLASADTLSVSARHNGSEAIPADVAASGAAAVGPPLDVWLGLHVSVSTNIDTLRSELRVSLAGLPLTPAPIELPNWDPQPGWTVRLRAIGSPRVASKVFQLRVVSGAMSDVSHIPMQVAVGPLFVSPQSDFTFYTPPVVRREGVTPSSGPVGGGTVVRILVANYSHTIGAIDDAALQLRCRFGDADAAVVAAFHWLDPNGTRIGFECTSPSAAAFPPPANAAGPVSLQLSPNGQQYSHAGGFMYYDEPVHVHASPRSGPQAGGALITLRGSNLHSGSDYKCRVSGVDVPATYVRAPGRVQCLSPNATAVDTYAPAPSSTIAVSLNAQQFVTLAEANGTFFVHRELVDGGRHLVVATPVSGPSDGGTSVIISLAGGGISLAARRAAARRVTVDWSTSAPLATSCARARTRCFGRDGRGSCRRAGSATMPCAASRRRLRRRALAT